MDKVISVEAAFRYGDKSSLTGNCGTYRSTADVHAAAQRITDDPGGTVREETPAGPELLNLSVVVDGIVIASVHAGYVNE